MEQAVPLHPWVPHGADLHAAAPLWVEEPPVEQVAVAWRRLRPVESPRRSRPRAAAAAMERSPRRSRGAGGSCRPAVGDPCWSSLLLGDGWMDGWSPWDGAVWEQCLRSCCLWAARVGSAGEGRHPMGGTPRGAGAGRDPEGHSAESALPVTILVEPSPCPYLSPGALCIVFSPPFPLRRGSERAAVVELGCPPALNHRSCKVLGKISFKKLNKVFNKEMQSFLLKASWRIGLLSYSQLRGRELLISPSFF